MSTTTIEPAIASPPVISIDQATQLGLAIHQQLHRPNLGSISPFGTAGIDFSTIPALDTDETRTAAVSTPFAYFVSVGLLTEAQAAALTAVVLGKAGPDSLPPADPGVASVYPILRLAVLHRAAAVTFGFWDVVGDLAEVVAGAALGFIAAGPAGAVAGGAIALMQVLDS